MAQFSDLFTTDERRLLLKRSDFQGYYQLFIHLGLALIGAWACLVSWGTWIYLPAALFLGIVLAFLFTAQHECIHRTAFKSKMVNDMIAKLIGWLLVLPSQHFRYFHFQHHRFTQDPERDPELETPKPSSWSGYVLHLSGLPYWWSAVKSVGQLYVSKYDNDKSWPAYIPKSARETIGREVEIMVMGYFFAFVISAGNGSLFLIKIWIIPILLGQPFLRAFLLAEHSGCDQTPAMHENTRTTLTHRFLRLISWNMSYHCEHHMAPAVPFHQLPTLHKRSQSQIKFLANGYGQVHKEIQKDLN